MEQARLQAIDATAGAAAWTGPTSDAVPARVVDHLRSP